MNARTGKPDNISLDLVFTKAIENLELSDEEIEKFKTFYATLQQATPRLCQNVLLLTVALGDIYEAREVTMSGGIVASKYWLTTKHIAHCASIERTLTSKSPYEYKPDDTPR